jgi:uncharacterized membrane protein YeaQ/YmgE (transglycosylase-associated protein family)
MHVLISIFIGILAGLLTALATKTASWVAWLVDVAIGIGGALPAAWFLAPLGTGQSLNRAEIAGACFGAVFLLALATLIAPRRKH